jgi:ABC-type uncharacterized transport system ATPase subunit
VGENGAGKSTLMNILYGFYQADGGQILIDGRDRAIRGSQDAIRAGIGMVHQHFMLVEPFTVLENLLLGAEGGFTLGSGTERARREIAGAWSATTGSRCRSTCRWAPCRSVCSSGSRSSRPCSAAPTS